MLRCDRDVGHADLITEVRPTAFDLMQKKSLADIERPVFADSERPETHCVTVRMPLLSEANARDRHDSNRAGRESPI